jgi:hypothetical protein
MASGPSTFRQSDLARALRAASKAGIQIERFEVDRDGKIVVFAGGAAAAEDNSGTNSNEWDAVK